MQPRVWQLRNQVWTIPPGGGIMGILNTTPDSFSDGGKHNTLTAAVNHAEKMLADGAHIIDIGGESTRPGATPTSLETEMQRTIPVIADLRKRHPHALLSIDTRHAEVAAAALDAGVDIINDISALSSPEMVQLCAERPCGIVIMHSLPFEAEPPAPNDMPGILHEFFAERLQTLGNAGIAPERICLDPGIGFGKRAEHTTSIIRNTEQIRAGNRPILMALSRKRFIGQLLYGTAHPVTEALPTVILSLLAGKYGADLHRVHDVAELRQALRLQEALSSC